MFVSEAYWVSPWATENGVVPQVIDAQPDDYMFNRGLALWASANFFVFRKINHKPDLHLSNMEPIARKWGEINHRYAASYVRKVNGRDLDSYKSLMGMSVVGIEATLSSFFDEFKTKVKGLEKHIFDFLKKG